MMKLRENAYTSDQKKIPYSVSKFESKQPISSDQQKR